MKQAVLVQFTMLNDGRSCWLSKTQRIYNEAGLCFKFSMAATEFTRQHVNEVMTQLSEQFVQDWYVQLSRPGGRKENMSNKLRTYRLFKKVFQLEYYLTCVTSTNYRKALTKLRVSYHHLALKLVHK